MSTKMEREQKSVVQGKATQPGLFARQPLSVLSKLALSAFLLSTLAGIGGIIALTLISGAPSHDILTVTAVTLAGTLILATGFRWGPVVSTLLVVRSKSLLT